MVKKRLKKIIASAALMALLMIPFVNAILTLTIQTNNQSYQLGATVKISGTLTGTANSQSIEIYIYRVRDHYTSFYTVASTDINGNYYSQWAIPNDKSHKGQYILSALYVSGSAHASANSTFTVS